MKLLHTCKNFSCVSFCRSVVHFGEDLSNQLRFYAWASLALFFDTFCILPVDVQNAEHVGTCRADKFQRSDMLSLFKLVDMSWEGEGYALDALPLHFHMLKHKLILKARKLQDVDKTLSLYHLK